MRKAQSEINEEISKLRQCAIAKPDDSTFIALQIEALENGWSEGYLDHLADERNWFDEAEDEFKLEFDVAFDAVYWASGEKHSYPAPSLRWV